MDAGQAPRRSSPREKDERLSSRAALGQHYKVSVRSSTLFRGKVAVSYPSALAHSAKVRCSAPDGYAALRSVAGIEAFSGLEDLHIEHCDDLTDLEDMVGLPQLTRIQIATCMNLRSWPDLRPSASFRYARLTNLPSLRGPFFARPETRVIRIGCPDV